MPGLNDQGMMGPMIEWRLARAGKLARHRWRLEDMSEKILNIYLAASS